VASARTIALLIAAVLAAPLRLAAQDPAAAASDAPLRIAVISDTQAPLAIERLLAGDQGNAEARELLFADLLADRSLRAVVHLGDMTSIGSLGSAWGAADRLRRGLASRGVPLLAVPGNHEYMPLANWGRAHFLRRFPGADLARCAAVGRVALLLVNSNRGLFSGDEWRAQLRRLATLADSCDRAPGVDAVIIACHHSPYTNSTVVGPEDAVLRDIVPVFRASRKAVLFASGHAHGAELFHVDGKRFLVSGGGGGILHRHLQGAERRTRDDFPLAQTERSFHYLVITVERDALHIEARMLDARRGALRTVQVERIAF
jgi:3',5'-cyclic AMP phosphodiesterase CpdA